MQGPPFFCRKEKLRDEAIDFSFRSRFIYGRCIFPHTENVPFVTLRTRHMRPLDLCTRHVRPLDSSLAPLGLLAPLTLSSFLGSPRVLLSVSVTGTSHTKPAPLLSDLQSSERVRTVVMEQVTLLSSWVRATDRTTPLSSTYLVARLLLYHLLSALIAVTNPSLMPHFHHSIYILILHAMEAASLDSQLFKRCNLSYFYLLIAQIPPST